MSFLNPPAATPRLGVDLATLVTLRDLRPSSRTLDLTHFARAAEEAGADAIRLAVDPSSLIMRRSDISAVMSAMTEVHFAMPLTREMIDFASTARPHAVRFHALDGAHGTVITAISLQLIHDALAQLRPQSVQIILSIDPAISQLQAAADAGINAVEFDAGAITSADPADQPARFSELRAAIVAARRLGMAVHLGHGIDYELVGQFAASGEITQITAGHAIATRAMLVGWQTAVREMKARMVAAYAPQMAQPAASTKP